MKTEWMRDEKGRRRWWPAVLTVLAVVAAGLSWNIAKERREDKALLDAGFTIRDPRESTLNLLLERPSMILTGVFWRRLGTPPQKKTLISWRSRPRQPEIAIRSLAPFAGSLRRARPVSLEMDDVRFVENVDALEGLTSLKGLSLKNCACLQSVMGLAGTPNLEGLTLGNTRMLRDVSGLKNLRNLKYLSIDGPPTVTNVDDLAGLTALQTLKLLNWTGLTNVNGLRELTSLKTLSLTGCIAIRDVSALKNLTGLGELYLNGCDALSEGTVAELQAALPHTKIQFSRISQAR